MTKIVCRRCSCIWALVGQWGGGGGGGAAAAAAVPTFGFTFRLFLDLELGSFRCTECRGREGPCEIPLARAC